MKKISNRKDVENIHETEREFTAPRKKPKLTGQKQKQKSIAYLRVSTDGQDWEKNKADILLFANNKDLGKVEFIEEKISGKIPWRERRIKEILDQLQRNDNLLVSELSRLGRSMLEIMEILSIAKDKGINVYAVKGNWTLNGTIESKIVGMVFAMAAEIERDLISSRTKEALRARKAAGVKLGRPKGPGKSRLDQYRPEIEALLKNGSTQVFIAKRYKVTPATLCNWIIKKKIDKEPMVHP
ncbi:MAG TPA: recombinase family protein [Syntrophorhabdaceae bacterium]|nr:recombinase family protein [Syntrophorhabdaceae bacterium]